MTHHAHDDRRNAKGRIRALALASALVIGAGVAGQAFAEPSGETNGSDKQREHEQIYALQRGELPSGVPSSGQGTIAASYPGYYYVVPGKHRKYR